VDDSWVPSSSGPNLVNDEPSFGLLQFTVSEVENALLGLDTSKGPDPNGIPPLILKSGASGFAFFLCMLFNRSLATCILPEIWNSRLLSPFSRVVGAMALPWHCDIVGYCQVVRIAGV
jgi:hypothetical protein